MDELIPRVPILPSKGAKIVLDDSLAIISPFLTFVSKSIGSTSSLFLILKEGSFAT
jgi:hypothetical protein